MPQRGQSDVSPPFVLDPFLYFLRVEDRQAIKASAPVDALQTEAFTSIFDNDKISSPNTIVMTKINSEWRRYHGAVRIR